MTIKQSFLAGLLVALLPSLSLADSMSLTGNASGGFTSWSPVVFSGYSFNTNLSGDGAVELKLGSFAPSGIDPFYSPQYMPEAFQLSLTMTLGGSAGENTQFTALLNGTVSASSNGAFLISFGSVPQSFAFSSGQESGTIYLHLSDFAVNFDGGSPTLIGRVTMVMNGGTVPDGGATVALLGIACLGIAVLRRKISA